MKMPKMTMMRKLYMNKYPKIVKCKLRWLTRTIYWMDFIFGSDREHLILLHNRRDQRRPVIQNYRERLMNSTAASRVHIRKTHNDIKLIISQKTILNLNWNLINELQSMINASILFCSLLVKFFVLLFQEPVQLSLFVQFLEFIF